MPTRTGAAQDLKTKTMAGGVDLWIKTSLKVEAATSALSESKGGTALAVLQPVLRTASRGSARGCIGRGDQEWRRARSRWV